MGFKKRGHKPPVGDEERASNWKVLDYGDVVIHLMSTEARAFYGLERLWGDGTPIDWQEVLREAGEAVPTPGN
jgi:ribosome-associated protein